MQGEVEYEVPPLQEPEAVFLFCERSQLEPSDEIAELCRRLDSLPLAVELAAARTKALSPKQILERLSQRLDLLKGGRDADPRQQTLRATIEWSYDLLTDDEQRLFRAVSVFAGGCTLEAAEEVAGADVDTLQSLVEKSLLRFSEERYWMLETIREYARDKLNEARESQEAELRHEKWMLSLLGERTPTITEEWLAVARPEAANLRVALERALNDRRVEPFVERAILLYRVWMHVGGAMEGQRWLADASAQLANQNVPLRARALAWSGELLRVMGRLREAALLVEEALRLYESVGDQAGRAGALETLGLIATSRGDLKEADEALADALRWRRSHDPATAGRLVANLADVALARHDFERAAELAAEALVEARRQRSAVGTGQTLLTLGIALFYTGSRAEAHDRLEEALTSYERVDFPEGIAATLDAIAAVEAEERPERAAELAGAAANLRDEYDLALDSFQREMHDSTMEKVDAAIGSEATRRASKRGAAVNHEQLPQWARGTSPSRPSRP